MKIFLLRHGQSEARAASDELRHLSNEGLSDIRAVARQFAQHVESLTLCICSPYLRAKESAVAFLEAASCACPLQTDAILVPETSAQEVMSFLSGLEQQETILLVGHNPCLTALFALLTQGATDQPVKIMDAGELCCIEFEVLASGLGACAYCLLPASDSASAEKLSVNQ
jgi:phosphohistidine phosphatase